MTITVRSATGADVGRVAAIHVAGYEEAYRGLVPDAVIDTRDVALRERVWQERLDGLGPDEFVFVGEIDGVAQGFVSGRAASADEAGRDGRIGCWENLYLDPECIGSSGGFRLALDLERTTRAALTERGYTEAVAFVIEGNERARRFFESLGWHADGTAREVEGMVQHRVRRVLDAPAATTPLKATR